MVVAPAHTLEGMVLSSSPVKLIILMAVLFVVPGLHSVIFVDSDLVLLFANNWTPLEEAGSLCIAVIPEEEERVARLEAALAMIIFCSS